MTEPDDSTATTALLGALTHVSHLLRHRTVQLRELPTMSNVTNDLSIDGPVPDEILPAHARDAIQDRRRQGYRGIVISGYVDAKPEGHHGAAWYFDVVDFRPAGWQVKREATLYPLEGDNVTQALADVDFPGWSELAAALPGLIEELLATPLPTVAN